MLNLMARQTELRIVDDQVGTPTDCHDLAETLLDFISFVSDAECQAEKQSNVALYHYANEGVASWYDFAVAIAEIAKLQVDIIPISSEQFPTPASRPKYSVLSKAKLKRRTSKRIPHWRVSLRSCISRWKNQ